MADISTPLSPNLQEAYYGSTHTSSGNTDLNNYNNWNGDLEGFLKYMSDHGSDSDYDRYIDFLMNNYQVDKSNAWTASREDSQYQRLVEDLRKAGINPYSLLANGGSPVSSSSASASYSGAYSSNEALKKEANSQKWASLFASLISTVVMAAILLA